MEIIKWISSAILPLFILTFILSGLIKRQDIYDAFIEGAKKGLETVFKIIPAMIGLLAAVYALRESGLLDLICSFATPFANILGIPPQTLPIVILRPISGSGSLALLNDILKTHGADSLIGKTASVMMGSTETTFYVIAVYFGAAGITNVRYAFFVALTVDLLSFILSAAAVRMLGFL